MAEWFEDESFWSELYPFIFSDERIERAPDEVDALLHLVPHRGRQVLDLCCGPGRHAVELGRRGFSVTGVDRSAYLLDRARDRAASAEVEVEWVRQDMREFVRPAGFDLAINLFTSLGYFADAGDDSTVLSNLHASLRPGGALVVELTGKEKLAETFQNATCDRAPDGTLLMQRHAIIDDWTRIENEWFLIRPGKGDRVSDVRRYRFTHWIYSASELRQRLVGAGFETVRLYGDWDGADYGPGSTRLIAVALR